MDPFVGARVRMDKWGEVVVVYFFDGGFLGVLVVFPVEVEGVEASTAALAAAATEQMILFINSTSNSLFYCFQLRNWKQKNAAYNPTE